MAPGDLPRLDLRIRTGRPRFAEPLHVSRPLTANRDAFRGVVDDIFSRAWLTNDGPLVRALEVEIAARHGVRHAVAVANGTLALQVLLRAHRITGEVILPSFTFVATAHAVSLSGLRPVFADIDRRSLTLDPGVVEELITPATSALLPVHLFGAAADTEGLEAIAARHGLRVIYDAAHGFAAAGSDAAFGSSGDGECLSFHATKLFNTFEGGAILTNDDAVADRCRLLRNFGFTGYDEVACIGMNAKMNELSAAHGLMLLPEVDAAIARAAEARAAYARLLPQVPGVSLVGPADRTGHGCQSLPVLIDEARYGLARDDLYRLLWHENVLARRYFHPGCHRLTPYRDAARGSMAVTERVADTILCLPAGPHVTTGDVATIVGLLAAARASRDEVRAWLASGQSADAARAANQAAHE